MGKKTKKFFQWLADLGNETVVGLGSWIGLDETVDKLLTGKPLKSKTGAEWFTILQKELNNLAAKGQIKQAELDDLNETIVRLGNSLRSGHVRNKVDEYEKKIRKKAKDLRSDIEKNEALIENIQADINDIADDKAHKLYSTLRDGKPYKVEDIRDKIKYVEGRLVK